MQRTAASLNFRRIRRFHHVSPRQECRLSLPDESPVLTRVFPDHIPDFAEAALDALYGSLYSSLPQLRLSSLDGVHTYAAWQSGQLRTLFLYICHGREIRVVNEGMRIDDKVTAHFARTLFDRHPDTERVHFRAVQCEPVPVQLPTARFTLTEDMVIALPTSEEAYVASLGKSTRKSLRQALARARARGIAHQLIPGDALDASLIRAVIGFNRARMAIKRRTSVLDETAGRKLLTLLHARGVVGAVTLDGRLCAGTLACRFGDDMYSLVNAHDPQYDALRLGAISRHLMILAAIRSGVRRFHLLGGNLASKQLALAQRVPLDDLLIYRSKIARLRHGRTIVRLQLAAWEHQLRSAMEDQELTRRAGRAMRATLGVARWLKEVRRGKRPLLGMPADHS
jgi:hypothetical protein